MKIIVGLGNPNKQYKTTRHNAGFIIVDALAEEKNLSWQLNKKFNAEIATGDDFILVKPQTFMNNSGQAVRAVMDFYKLMPKPARGWSALGGKLGLFTAKDSDLSKILTVIHDDVDFELGIFKPQTNRSSGGHRGVQSIINHLKTQNFTRVRVGIANSHLQKMPTDKFVLERFSKEEQIKLSKVISKVVDEIREKY